MEASIKAGWNENKKMNEIKIKSNRLRIKKYFIKLIEFCVQTLTPKHKHSNRSDRQTDRQSEWNIKNILIIKKKFALSLESRNICCAFSIEFEIFDFKKKKTVGSILFLRIYIVTMGGINT